MASVYKRGDIWWIRFQYRGKRFEKTARTTKKAEALRYLVRVQEEVRQRDFGDRPRRTFKEMVERYRAEHLPQLRPSTQRGYGHLLRYLEAHFDDIEITRIGKAEIADLVSVRRQQGVGGSAIRRVLACLSSVYSCACGWDWIDRNPVQSFPKRTLRENPPRMRYLTRDEYERLLASASPMMRSIIALAVNTGLRRSELLNLTWTQIDLNRHEIALMVTKSGKPRVIPLTREAIAVLASLPRYPASPYVFHNPFTGRPIQEVKTAFSRALRRAGIENCRFHDLRHTFASWAVQSGMDLYRLSRILGHTTTQMTQRYAHLATRDLHRAITEMETNLTTNSPETPPSTTAKIIEWRQVWTKRPKKN